MYKSVLWIVLLSSFSLSDGILCPSCPAFQKKSVAEQDKIIENDFKTLHREFKNLNLIVGNIDKTRKNIENLKIQLAPKNEVCFALSLLKSDLNILISDLSKLKDKNSKEYQEIYRKYINYKKTYDIEKSKSSCKELR